jgi:hypothetical protein
MTNIQEELQDSIIRVVNGPSGPVVNSVVAPRLVGSILYLYGDMYIYGAVKNTLVLEGGVSGLSFENGSAVSPSVSFVGDPTSGYYLASPGVLGISSGGNSVAAFGPTGLTSVSGDLVINSASSNIDFSGKNLVNVGGIAVSDNAYDVIAPTQITTTNTTPTILITIPLAAAAYTITTYVTATTLTNAMGGYTSSVVVKNVGGVVTIGNQIAVANSIEADLNGSSINYTSSGTNLLVQVIGISGTVKWFGASKIVRSLF